MLGLYLAMCSSEEEKEKIEYIYENYYQVMYRAAYSVVRKSDLIPDILQDTMVKLIRNSATIRVDGNAPVKTYVVAAARNAAIDYMRVNCKKEYIDMEDISIRWDIEDASPSVVDTIISIDGYNDLVRCIRELPDTYKNACYLKYVCELNEGEIAAVLDITYANVAARIHRGRKILQKKITEVQKNEK